MDITIFPRKLSGTVRIIPSKSQAHRLLICAAFADRETTLICPETSQDMEATAQCLNAMGAQIKRTEIGFHVIPVQDIPNEALLDCKESGSTLRFLLPVAAALGIHATFSMSGRLPYRPLSPLWEELERMGCKLSRPTENTVLCTGQLRCGQYCIDGGVSSQFITGLLFALALLPGESTLQITGRLESKPYIHLTEQALSLFGVDTADYRFHGSYPLRSPVTVEVEGDWSNGAFFICANALGNQISVTGLNTGSVQGDKAVMDILPELSNAATVSGADIPDLIPILAVTAGALQGATFEQIGRLRLKESDRVASVCGMVNALGAKTQVNHDSMTVYPGSYHACVIDSRKDHRIAMAAAIASTVAQGPVTILGAECVQKSYPSFWSEFVKLGGYYEQYIR